MAVNAEWHDPERTVIIYRVEGTWDWGEFYRAVVRANALLDTVAHTVDFLVDMSRSTSVPAMNPAVMPFAAHNPTLDHENAGVLVVAGASAFVKTIFDIFARFYSHSADRYYFSATLAGAESILQAHQASAASPAV